jgi:hypothetical protein
MVVAGASRRARCGVSKAMTSKHSNLAHAYLALADDPEPSPNQRSVPRALCALAAALVLAVAAPLAWASAGEPRDQPVATAGSKAGGVEGDDDDGDGDDDDAGGGTWAATNA